MAFSPFPQPRLLNPSFRMLLASLPFLFPNPGFATSPSGVKFFEEKIRPVLVEHCYSCHSGKAKKVRGGLLLDTRAGLLAGGDSGPALVPGKPHDSLLLRSLHQEKPSMPPKGKLPDAILADFRRWIQMGAPDPREGKSDSARPALDLEGARKFWSFQPPRSHTPSAVADTTWPRTTIDRFLLAELEASELPPASDADRRTLLRRVTLDLTGLPPTPDEIHSFLTDSRPDAFERVVARLLASPAFGERWGRHWLDVARYADSSGKGDNLTYHDAWRYRDYVINAFNADKPYDTFLREQLAGDLLPAANQTQRDEQLIATGFLVLGPKQLRDRDVLRRKMDVVDDQVDTIGRAILGLTLGCARCHDHKLDPIPTTDYYALAGILSSTRTLDSMRMGRPQVSGWMLRPLGANGEKLFPAYLEHQLRLQKARKALADARGSLDPAAKPRLKELETAEKALLATAPPAPNLALAVRDEAEPADVPVALRGDPHSPGALVPRGFVSVLSAGPTPAIPKGHSGRLELANWLVNPRNPLTARVMVNRVWLHLFGQGLVRSVDNFGVQGEKPSHPELLDELSERFMVEGWSVKTLIRQIVLSRAYQLANRPASEGVATRAARVDPDNRLLWRAPRRRLEAEVLRDAVLAVSGQLDRSMRGSAVAELPEEAIAGDTSQGGLPTEHLVRRSVYLPLIRNDIPPLLDVFDFADPDVSTGRRDTTTVPTQALYLMNSPFVIEQSRVTARRLLALSAGQRLQVLYQLALGRSPTAQEEQRAGVALKKFRSHRDSTGEEDAWAIVCQAVFCSTEFRFVE